MTVARRHPELVVGIGWAVLAAAAILWVFGTPTRTAFQFPDEVATARGAQLVAERGTPAAPIPFDDPTGLARMRMWVRAGDEHVASVPATAPYVYGLPQLVPGGEWLLVVLPAAGVGLLGAAGMRLARREPWLGAALPALAFPALYWLLRPWHNVSLELALAAAAGFLLLGFARQRDGGDQQARRLGYAAVGVATLAALVRPDHVHLLLGVPLVWTLAVDGAGGRWRRWLGVYAVAAMAWVAINVAGNLATTGDPLTTPVDLLDFPSEVTPVGRDLPFPLPELLLVLAPRGWPDWGLVAEQLGKYWLRLGPVAPVVLAGVVATGALAVRAWRRRRPVDLAGLATMALLGWHAVSRVSATDLGAAAADPALAHSYPRYTALVYVGLAAVAIAGIARIDPAGSRRAAGGALAAVGVAGTVWLFLPPVEQEGLAALRDVLREADAYAEAVATRLPDDAIVYSQRVDKYVWDAHPVGKFQDERVELGVGPVAFDRLATSFGAALDAGWTPYLLELTEPFVARLRASLASEGLRLVELDLDLPEVTGIPDPPVHRVERG